MTRQRIEAYLERKIDALNAGDADLLVRLVRPPVPVFHPGGDKYTITEADIRASVAATHDGLKAIGADRVGARLLDVSEQMGTGTLSCLVELRYLSAEGAVLRTTRMRHFLELDDEDVRVVMLEYLHVELDKLFPGYRRPV